MHDDGQETLFEPALARELARTYGRGNFGAGQYEALLAIADSRFQFHAIIERGQFPFPEQGRRNPQFLPSGFDAWHMDDIGRLETLAGRLGLANEADVVKAFGRVVEYGEGYFRMLASHAGYDEWHCTDANFYVLALICNFVEQLAVDDLMALNRDETFAKRVLTTTLAFVRRRAPG
ncbi:hypothetical protein GQ57_20260 [Burkholderia sp. MSh2]|nr:MULTISPECIES: hypothetical protein [Burkholderia]KEZ04260.1 hypothetical protein GQ57_20260 [Burkholderia sp. MSh2]